MRGKKKTDGFVGSVHESGRFFLSDDIVLNINNLTILMFPCRTVLGLRIATTLAWNANSWQPMVNRSGSHGTIQNQNVPQTAFRPIRKMIFEAWNANSWQANSQSLGQLRHNKRKTKKNVRRSLSDPSAKFSSGMLQQRCSEYHIVIFSSQICSSRHHTAHLLLLFSN